MAKRVHSTKGQCDELRHCNPGVGFLVYNAGNGSTVEFEFYIDKTGQLRYIANGQPVQFEVYRGD